MGFKGAGRGLRVAAMTVSVPADVISRLKAVLGEGG